ncbi:MAG: DNA mismatch repair endonuclease MutL [Pseudomonadota bacterium]
MVQPAPIHRLPADVANQIAAGEVVERPASVVKELVENAIDAGASHIRIDIEQAGSRLIRVVDNGSGIAKTDLALSVLRHTTSKLRASTDLTSIATLGFRGEALASIASVSRFRIASRVDGDVHGWACVVQPDGESTELLPREMPVGTEVEVRDLFFSVPARRKFLRAERTEVRHIEDVVKRAALSHVSVALVLRVDGRNVLNVKRADDAPSIAARLRRIVGNDFSQQSLPLDADVGGLRLHGWVGASPSARALADRQYFFLNGRAVRDPVLRHAVRSAFEGALHAGHHPSYVLYLDMPRVGVDVNVHPTKHEVRFRDARNVHDFVMSAIKRRVQQGVDPSPDDRTSPPDGRADDRRDEEVQMGDLPRARSSGSAFGASSASTRSNAAGSRLPNAHAVRETIAGYRALAGEPDAAISGGFQAESAWLGRCIATLGGRWMLFELPREGLNVVDVELVAQALFLDRLQSGVTGSWAQSQPLLVPVRITHALEPSALSTLVTGLANFGLSISATETGLTLREVPALLREANHRALLDALLAMDADGWSEEGPAPSGSARVIAEAASQALLSASTATRVEVIAQFGGDALTPPYGRRLSVDDVAAWIRA